jgi:thioredoxin 1
MGNVAEIQDTDFTEALKTKEFSLVDVYASWCGSCRMFAPVFHEIADRNPDLGFFKIDGEKNPKFCEQVPIDNLPFVAVFHNGKFVGGQSTSKRDALEEIVGMIRSRPQ